jgi:hypothetical protein
VAACIAVAKKTGSNCYLTKLDETAMNWVGRFFQRPKSLLIALAKAALRQRRRIAHPAKMLAGIYLRTA